MTGESLRAWRRGHGLTQHQVADLLGVTVNTVSRWELGEMAIRHATMVSRILAAYDAGRTGNAGASSTPEPGPPASGE